MYGYFAYVYVSVPCAYLMPRGAPGALNGVCVISPAPESGFTP